MLEDLQGKYFIIKFLTQYRINANNDKENCPEIISQDKPVEYSKPTPKVKSQAKRELVSDLTSARNQGSTGPQTVMD